MKQSIDRVKVLFSILTSVLFLGAISLPSILMVSSSPKKSSEVERRPLAHTLEFSKNLKQDLFVFKAYLNDQIGLREQIILTNNFLRVRYLRQSPVPEVIIGKNDWLFYEKELGDYRKTDRFSEEELHTIQLNLEARRDRLAEQGVKYVLVIAPNKSTIYPEFMPDRYSIVEEESAFDQLLVFLKANSDFDILDLRPALLYQKQNKQVYYRYDTHWNDEGAYIAYKAIIERLKLDFPFLEALSFSDVNTGTQAVAGDLSDMLGGEAIFEVESSRVLFPLDPCAKTSNYEISIPHTSAIYSVCQDAEIKGVILHDSFFLSVNPFLRETFRESIFFWGHHDPMLLWDLVADIRPQVVLEEIAERDISNFLYEGYH